MPDAQEDAIAELMRRGAIDAMQAKGMLQSTDLSKLEIGPGYQPPEGRTIPTTRGPHRIGPTRTDYFEQRGFMEEPGLGLKSRAASAVGTDDELRAVIARELGVDVSEVDVGDMEGVGTVYRVGTEGGFKPIDPIGIDTGDVIEGLVAAPEVIGSLLAAIPTAIVTKSPTLTKLASAGGAGIGRAGVVAILEAIDVLDPEERNAAIEGAKAAGFDLAATFGLGGAVRAKEFLRAETRALDALRTSPISVTPEALEVGIKAAEKEGLPQPSASQALALGGEVEAAQVLKTAERGEASVRARAQRLSREGLERPVAEAGKQFEEAAGVAIQKDIAAGQAARIAGLRALPAAAKEIADKFTKEITGKAKAQAGFSIRKTAEKARENIDTVLRKEYNAITKEIPEGLKVNTAGIRSTAKSLMKKEILIPEIRETVSSIVGRLSKAGLKKTPATATAKPGFKDIGVDFVAVREALSDLKAILRSKDVIGITSTARKDLKDLIGALQKARQDTLSSVDPALAKRLIKNDTAWREAIEDLDDGIIGAVLRKDKMGLPIADETVISKILGSADNVRDLVRVATKRPELNIIGDLRQSLYRKYSDKVINGKMSHADFIADNKEAMGHLFDKSRMKVLSVASRANNLVERMIEKEEALLSSISKEFGTKVSKYEPSTIVQKTWGDPADVRKMISLLKLSGDKKKAYVEGIYEQAYKDITSKGKIQVGSLDKLLKSDKKIASLNAVGGKKYIKSLGELRDRMVLEEKAAVKGAAAIGGKGTSDLDVLSAGIFGPLNHKRYFLNVFGAYGEEKTRRALAKMVEDPALLAKALRLRNVRLENRRWRDVLNAAGFEYIISDKPTRKDVTDG